MLTAAAILVALLMLGLCWLVLSAQTAWPDPILYRSEDEEEQEAS